MFEIIYHPLFGELNDIGQPKPYFESYETPLRTKVIWEYFKQIKYINWNFEDFEDTDLYVNPNESEICINKDKNLAFKTPGLLKKEDLYRVHTKYHVQLVENFSKIGSGQIGNLVQATPDTFDIALLSAGGAYQAIKDVYERKFNQSFAIIRPPGHHAIPDAADGLCVFNNIAIAVEKLRNDVDFNGKIAILDFDAHYGDGLAKIFYEDPKVLYSSIHEFDYGVGEAGFLDEQGSGKGLGYNINYPIPLDGDDSYLISYCEFIEPFLEKFSPEMIIIAAGFDGYWADPIGNLNFTTKGYQFFSEWLKKTSEKICGGRVCYCLEGGYNLLILPHLVEIMINGFIGGKTEKKIDNWVYPLFSNELDQRTDSTPDEFRIHFNKKIKKISEEINQLW
ncbi:MAG: histone deacetylase [archaeon]|nr:histone deacetylase [archaeon]